ncbi:MAG: hypothetical protein AAF585_01045, partial [Verrucomicrobiota bacterium]
INPIVSKWAGSDLKSAMHWVENLTDLEELESGMYSIAVHMADSDPVAAAAYLEIDKRLPNDRRTYVMQTFATIWTKQDKDSAYNWAKSTGETTVIMDAIKEHVSTDFDWVIDKVGEQPDDEIAWVARKMYENLSRVNPSLAFNKVLNSPFGSEVQNNAMKDVVFQWSATDPLEASTMLNEMPKGELRDFGVMGLWIYLLSKGDYDSARSWAESIDSPHWRNLTLFKLDERIAKSRQ